MFKKVLYWVIAIVVCYFGIRFIINLCQTGEEKPPIDLTHNNTVKNKGHNNETENNTVKVKYREMNGVYVIPVKLNGVSKDMIFDSGCSGISISSLEIMELLKYGQISETDIEGYSENLIADGSSVVNMVINLKSIQIGEGDNAIILTNRKATVVDNLAAPVLIGGEVIKEMANVSFDQENKTINFTKK